MIRFRRPPHAPAAALLAGLSLLLTACLFENKVGENQGGGSDTETLTGSVATPTGAPAARTMVKLIPADYDPSLPDAALIRRALTDEAGRFRFGKLEEGRAYNVIAGSAAENAWAFASGVHSGAEIGTLPLARAKVFLFNLHSADYQRADSGIAYFPGTDILTRCDGISFSTVDSVPSGALRFVVESRAGWAHDTTLVSAAEIDTAKVVATKNGINLYP